MHILAAKKEYEILLFGTMSLWDRVLGSGASKLGGPETGKLMHVQRDTTLLVWSQGRRNISQKSQVNPHPPPPKKKKQEHTARRCAYYSIVCGL